MRPTLNELQHRIRASYNVYKESRDKAKHVIDLYHNRQYTEEQLEALRRVGQPPQTFNIIKLFTRQLIGYYSAVIGDYNILPRQPEDVTIANLLSDVVKYVNEHNSFGVVMDEVKLYGFLTGIFASQISIEPDTKAGKIRRDKFGRTIYKIVKEPINPLELLLDPLSTKADYSDARYIDRFKWVSEETIKQINPNINLNRLEEYYNGLGIEEAEVEERFGTRFITEYGETKLYLLVQSYTKMPDNTINLTQWVGDTIISSETLDYPISQFPIRITKLNDSDKAEFYGIFEDVYASQDAINQALVQIQLLIGGKKAFVEESAVDNLDDFIDAYNRVNAVIPVINIQGIKIEKLTEELQEQFIIIDKAFDRIQRVLNINDSFLGMAFQYDSGKKVQLQQNATTMALRYIDTKLRTFYQIDAQDTLGMISKYFKASYMISLSEEGQQKWLALNQPLINPQTGRPIWREAINPLTGEQETDENGMPVYEPVIDPDTDLTFTDYDLMVDIVPMNNEVERNQVLIETILNGTPGQVLLQMNPGAYLKAVAMSIKNSKTRNSPEMAQLFIETANMLQPQPHLQEQLAGNNPRAGGQPNTQITQNRLAGEAK